MSHSLFLPRELFAETIPQPQSSEQAAIAWFHARWSDDTGVALVRGVDLYLPLVAPSAARAGAGVGT